MQLDNKNTVVLGLGASGLAAAELLLKRGATVTVRDNGKQPVLDERVTALKTLAAQLGCTTRLHVELGDRVQSTGAFDLAVLSPGLDPTWPIVTNVTQRGVPILSELELGYRLCKCPIVAITGTNGKTTTTELVHSVLAAGGKRVEMAGNIGTPLCALAEKSAQLDLLVVEVSSFQLEEIEQFKPAVSIHLNLTPDHLDRYPNMHAYRDAKWNIFKNQDVGDLAIVNVTVEMPTNVKAQVLWFGVDSDKPTTYAALDGKLYVYSEIVFDQTETRLIGPHNSENLLAALAVADYYNVSREATFDAFRKYHPLPHRCEVVGNIDGVPYINDSKATNIDALEKALMAVQGPIVLIAGGKDKGLEFGYLSELLKQKVSHAVLIGQMTAKLTAAWGESVPCVPAATLEAAVNQARTLAGPTHTVLFSPGCSSFDMFKNYEDRGDQFRALVTTLSNQHNKQTQQNTQ